MRIKMALVVLALTPLSAGAFPRGDELVLRKRRVEVLVNENLARVTLTWNVANPGLRPLEGEVVFKAPKGAVVTEAILLKHISSADHRSKLLAAERASLLYEAIKKRDLTGEELREVTGLGGMASLFGQPIRPQAGAPPTSGWNGLLKRQNSSSEIVDGKAYGVWSGLDMKHAPPDPALVSWLGDDSYRLRFFPVPANDDQTVSVTLTVETNSEGMDRGLRVPLAFKDNFVAGAKAEYDASLRLQSANLLEFVGSTSHTFSVQKGSPRTSELAISAREEKPASELTFEYRLGPNTLLKAREVVPGVSPHESLLVIARSDQKEAERQAPAPAVGAPNPEDLKKCGFIRAGAAGCSLHTVVTSDPVRLKWARDHGLSPRPRKGGIGFGQPWVYEFDYVLHSAGCPVGGVDPAKLKALAAAVK